jgi:hypothetical protein
MAGKPRQFFLGALTLCREYSLKQRTPEAQAEERREHVLPGSVQPLREDHG